MKEEKEVLTNEDPKEPSLFPQKGAKAVSWKAKFFWVFAFLAVGYLLWPKGSIEGEGIVQAKHFIRMGLTTKGVLRELFYRKGDFVVKNGLIARFEDIELSQKFAKAKLDLEVLAHEKEQLTKTSELLKKEAEAKSFLYENGAAARLDVDKLLNDQFQIIEELAINAKKIEALEGEKNLLKAQVDSLELKAPFDGMLLTDPGITVGNLLKEGDFVLEFADPKTFFIEILVPEKQVEKIDIGNEVSARFPSFSWKSYSGEVARVGPRITDEVEKVFNVRHVVPCEIKLNEFPQAIKYGTRARVKIKTNNQKHFNQN